jgi:hypothetical protein
MEKASWSGMKLNIKVQYEKRIQQYNSNAFYYIYMVAVDRSHLVSYVDD